MKPVEKTIYKKVPSITRGEMETVVLLTMSVISFVYFFVIVPKISKHRKLSEFECIKGVNEQLVLVQDFLTKLDTVLREKEEHIMKCILYSAVRVCQPIRGIRVDTTVTLQFKDVRVTDAKGKNVPFNINRKVKQTWGYRVCNGSSFEEDKNELLIEFESPVVFKYIEFMDMGQCQSNARVRLLTQGDDIVVVINKEKHVICNTVTQ